MVWQSLIFFLRSLPTVTAVIEGSALLLVNGILTIVDWCKVSQLESFSGNFGAEVYVFLLVAGFYDILVGNYPELYSFTSWARETEEVNPYL